jgi:Ca2+-binding EF-hand superfamily protein
VTWSSFLYASFDDKILSKENLKGVFKFLDSDQNGYLTYESFKNAFQRRGHKFKNCQIDEMLQEAGLSPAT